MDFGGIERHTTIDLQLKANIFIEHIHSCANSILAP